VRSYPIRRLGILRLSAIGDVVHALPLAMGLRRAFPAARITWVVQRAAAPLLQDHPAVDEVLIFPRRGGLREWAHFVSSLRARRFDATVDPQGNLKSGVVGVLSGARVRAGLHRRDCKEWGNVLLTNRVPPDPDSWGLTATETERAHWRERCREAGADPDGPLLALHLTDPDAARSWFIDAWAELAREAVDAGFQVLLNGTAERRGLARAVRCVGAYDLTGRDDLRGFLAQLESMAGRRGNALVAPDSGPVHLATAVGLPVVCLSGPQDPLRTGPRQRGVAVTAWQGLACAPCLERTCIRQPPDRACMRNLAPATVLDRLFALVGRPRR
jgi:heptosyltransferase-1